MACGRIHVPVPQGPIPSRPRPPGAACCTGAAVQAETGNVSPAPLGNLTLGLPWLMRYPSLNWRQRVQRGRGEARRPEFPCGPCCCSSVTFVIPQSPLAGLWALAGDNRSGKPCKSSANPRGQDSCG